MLLLRQGTQEEEQMARGGGGDRDRVPFGACGIRYFPGQWALGLGVSEMCLLSYRLEKRIVSPYPMR